MSQPVYTVGYLRVKDHAEYMERYGQHLPPIIEKYGGRFLAATPIAATVEGELSGNWAVLTHFPSSEQAQAFYTSEEYASYLDMRLNELTEGGLMVTFADQLPKM